MRRIPLLAGIVGFGFASCLLLPPAAAQTTGGFPTISARQFTGGSAKVTVTGSTRITQEIPLNTIASISDGESTWLQFGASGSAEPNALVTYGQTKEIGIIVGQGKFNVTGGLMPGETSECSGKATVTATLISGDYVCAGLVSKEAAGGMGKVDVKVSFTAKS
jgi:hypothetical protein